MTTIEFRIIANAQSVEKLVTGSLTELDDGWGDNFQCQPCDCLLLLIEGERFGRAELIQAALPILRISGSGCR
jgi:hypothetical protein